MKYQIIFIIVASLALGSCNSTKYVPENDYLLSDLRINSDELDLNPTDLKPYLKQKPNLTILGLVKFHLGLYNLSGFDQSKWWNRWFRRIGEEPVIYDEFMTERSADELEKYLNNKGFLHASVSDTTYFNEKTRKARVEFDVKADTPFVILSHNMNIKDERIRQIVKNDSANTFIKEGKNFDISVLNKERDRITRLLRQNGYFNFSRDFMSFYADSTRQPFGIIDTLVIKNPMVVNSLKQRVEGKHEQYKIRDVYFIVDFDPQKALKEQAAYYRSFDTIDFEGFKILYQDELYINPVILTINNLIYPNALYNYKDRERTHALLSSIPIIKYVNIRFAENNTVEPSLDCYIQITKAQAQEYSVNLEGTHQNGNIGAAVNLGYSHKNLFRSGEMFNTTLSYARETRTSLKDNNNFNSDEFGFETSLLYPRFLFPVISKRFSENFKSNTNFTTAYNYQDRPDYKRYIASVGMQYKWKGKSNWSHQFDILDWNYVSLPFKTDTFKNYIDSTFLEYSYENHLILGMGYSVSYNDQTAKNYRDSRYFRFGVESSGNTMQAYKSLTNAPKVDDAYQFVGIKYSQYIKFDLEGTYNRRIDEKNAVVYHAAFGVGIPYGNVDVMPFEKRYFGGGANGVRGWQVRSLGPGTYYSDKVNYVNQSGDIRLQANLEYRFKLFWVIEGALFSDLGNVWTIRDYPKEQPGGVFKFDTFYQQLAFAYGMGARLDFSFFVFRLDLGIKGFDPVRNEGDRWISGPGFKNDMTLHLAIGYPF